MKTNIQTIKHSAFAILAMAILCNCFSKDHLFNYHRILITASDPEIILFNIPASQAIGHKSNGVIDSGFIRESPTSDSKCLKLEFFNDKGNYFNWVGFPPVVRYKWDNKSLSELLEYQDGEAFNKEEPVIPNRYLYQYSERQCRWLISSFVNDSLVNKDSCQSCNLDSIVQYFKFSMYKSGKSNIYKCRN